MIGPGEFQCRGCLRVKPEKSRSEEFPNLCGGCGVELHKVKNPKELTDYYGKRVSHGAIKRMREKTRQRHARAGHVPKHWRT